MEIVIITTDYPPDVGGIQTIVFNIVHNLARKGNEVHVIAPYRGLCPEIEHVNNIYIHRLFDRPLDAESMHRFTGNIRTNILSVLGLFKLILTVDDECIVYKALALLSLLLHFKKTLKLLDTFLGSMEKLKGRAIDIVHAAHPGRAAIVAFFLARKLAVPLVTSTYGTDVTHAKKLSVDRIFLKALVRKSSVILTLSSFIKRQISCMVQNRRIEILPPGVDMARFKPYISKNEARRSLGLESDDQILLTACRLVKRKGVDNVLKALSMIVNHFGIKKIRYLVIGDGPEGKNLLNIVDRLKLGEYVAFLGEIPHSDARLTLYYLASDIFVMTPREVNGDVEGFGVVFLEANAVGKPVIGSRSGGVPDAVHDGINGLLVTPDSPYELALAIQNLLSDKLLYSCMAEQGKMLAQGYTWARITEHLIHVYESTI